MKSIKRILKRMVQAILLVACMTSTAQAAGPGFDNISTADLEAILQDFAGAFTHTTVSPASSLGKMFGFELGVVAGVAQTPGIEKLNKEYDPTSDFSAMPHAAIVAMVTVPFGLTVEAAFLPEQDTEDVDLSLMSIGLKWTLTESLLSLPVDLAVRGFQTNADIGFQQVISPATTPTDVDIETSMTGFGLLVSKKLTVFEPYLGLGMVSGDGDLKIGGSNSFLDSNALSANADFSGSHIFAGFNLNLLILKLGLEYGKVIDADRASAKLALAF